MPITDQQSAYIHPQLADMRRQCEGLPAPERAILLRRALETVQATPSWDEWEAFVRAELGELPAALARPDEAR